MAFKIFSFSKIGTTKDLMTCCSGTIEFVGVVGILLLVAGTLQMGSGVYFMLTMPVFSVASNIWTGVVSGLTGTVLTYFGCSDQSRRRPYVLLVFCIVDMVANVANIVITQVGDKALHTFTLEPILESVEVEKEQTMKIGLWVTTGATITSLASAFILANYLFCSQLKGRCLAKKQSPLLKTISEEVLHQQKKSRSSPNRFFSPSRLIQESKEQIQVLPSIEDMLTLPDPNFTKGNSSWVYNSDDKVSLGLYPLGIEVHLDVLETPGRHPPARHSSFAAPRYAKVHKRPQRAQSFVTKRDPFSLHSEGQLLKAYPVCVPRLPRRSNSITLGSLNCGITRTLSSKYRAFTLDREVDQRVIEVGSMKSSSSEHSLANALIDLPTEKPPKKVIEKYTDFNRQGNSCSTYSVKKGPSCFTKGIRTKGPAPPPPMKECLLNINFKKSNADSISSSNHKPSVDSSLTLEGEDSNASNTRVVDSEWESKNEMEEINNSEAYDSHTERFNERLRKDFSSSEENADAIKTQRKEQITHFTAKRNGEVSNYEMQKPPRLSLPKDTSFICNSQPIEEETQYEQIKNDISKNSSSDVHKALFNPIGTPRPNRTQSMALCSTYSRQPSKRVVKDISVEGSHYDTIRKQLVKDSKALLRMLPNTEVQRNKIVLRVPSFKTTGCQTESYRPVKRRNTLCSQVRYSSPGELCKMTVWKPPLEDDEPKLITLSTSSSGYSSPEGDSKENFPVQSGPPSPGSSYEAGTDEEYSGCDQNGPNVTIIEVNKDFSKQFQRPPRPPKPLRFRPVSDASALYSRGSNSHLRRSSIPLPIYEENFSMAEIPENDTLVTEAVNSLLVHNSSNAMTIPRIVNVIEKSITQPNRIVNNTDPNNNNCSISSANHTSIRRFSNRSFDSQEQSSSRTVDFGTSYHGQSNANFLGSASTAAYLASLELLASHYRQQALANAKQLQMQQRLLDQQKMHNQAYAIEQISSHSEVNQPIISSNNGNTE